MKAHAKCKNAKLIYSDSQTTMSSAHVGRHELYALCALQISCLSYTNNKMHPKIQHAHQLRTSEQNGVES